MFRRLRVAIHWERKMQIIAVEHDNSADGPTLKTWWQEDTNHKPDPFQEPLLGFYLFCPKHVEMLSRACI
jgi:hypothetical protein